MSKCWTTGRCKSLVWSMTVVALKMQKNAVAFAWHTSQKITIPKKFAPRSQFIFCLYFRDHFWSYAYLKFFDTTRGFKNKLQKIYI